jgi:hypothetical protein
VVGRFKIQDNHIERGKCKLVEGWVGISGLNRIVVEENVIMNECFGQVGLPK